MAAIGTDTAGYLEEKDAEGKDQETGGNVDGSRKRMNEIEECEASHRDSSWRSAERSPLAVAAVAPDRTQKGRCANSITA